MKTETPAALFECLMQFNNCNRYQAHARIDENFAGLAHHEARTWHPSVVQIDHARFAAGVRTADVRTIDSLPQASWRELMLPGCGEDVICRVEVAPKKLSQFEAFRERDFATTFLETRIARSGAFESFSVEYLASSMVAVAKQKSGYVVPAAWFEIKGCVASQQALKDLVANGVGGSHSFGVGLLTPNTSRFYPAVMAASERRIELAACTA